MQQQCSSGQKTPEVDSGTGDHQEALQEVGKALHGPFFPPEKPTTSLATTPWTGGTGRQWSTMPSYTGGTGPCTWPSSPADEPDPRQTPPGQDHTHPHHSGLGRSGSSSSASQSHCLPGQSGYPDREIPSPGRGPAPETWLVSGKQQLGKKAHDPAAHLISAAQGWVC